MENSLVANLTWALDTVSERTSARPIAFCASTTIPTIRSIFSALVGGLTQCALAGMIHFLGLARPELAGLDRSAWAIFADDDQSLPVSKRFASGARYRHAFGIEMPARIHFVGVWDTVSAFGFVWNPRTVPYSANNPSIDHIRHAVSIDEHRACFQANLFRPKSESQHQTYKQRGSPAHMRMWVAATKNAKTDWRRSRWSGCTTRQQLNSADSCRIRRTIFWGERAAKILRDVQAAAHNSTTGFWHLLEFIAQAVGSRLRT